MTKPLLAYLKDHGVKFEYDTQVQNVLVDTVIPTIIACVY